MTNLLVKEFNGTQIHTFMWNNKPCWIANQIVSTFGYSDPSTIICQCIDTEEFEEGIEYQSLIKDDLKYFKKVLNEVTKSNLVGSAINKYASKLIIFYEDGLYGFLQYTNKPIGVKFRKWLRREVLPEIRETGSYIAATKLEDETFNSSITLEPVTPTSIEEQKGIKTYILNGRVISFLTWMGKTFVTSRQLEQFLYGKVNGYTTRFSSRNPWYKASDNYFETLKSYKLDFLREYTLGTSATIESHNAVSAMVIVYKEGLLPYLTSIKQENPYKDFLLELLGEEPKQLSLNLMEVK